MPTVHIPANRLQTPVLPTGFPWSPAMGGHHKVSHRLAQTHRTRAAAMSTPMAVSRQVKIRATCPRQGEAQIGDRRLFMGEAGWRMITAGDGIRVICQSLTACRAKWVQGMQPCRGLVSSSSAPPENFVAVRHSSSHSTTWAA